MFLFGSVFGDFRDKICLSLAQSQNHSVFLLLALDSRSECSEIYWFPDQGLVGLPAKGLVGFMSQLVRGRVASGFEGQTVLLSLAPSIWFFSLSLFFRATAYFFH